MGRTSDARQRLMDAAFSLIFDHSYGAVTIDAICERAAVKKGSFYYFFTSKSDLAATAFDSWWAERQVVLDGIFSKNTTPLDRLTEYMEFIAKIQLESYEASGQMLGCPLHALGTEICTQDEPLTERIRDMLKIIRAHFERVIREAQAAGQVEGTDADQKARILMSYYAGVLTQARIENNPEVLRTLGADSLAIVGGRPRLSAPRGSEDLLSSLKQLGLPAQLAPFS